MSLAAVALDDKYEQDKGRVYLTGTQALVRLPLMQRRRDQLRRASTPPATSPAIAARPWAGLDLAATQAQAIPRARTTSTSSRA